MAQRRVATSMGRRDRGGCGFSARVHCGARPQALGNTMGRFVLVFCCDEGFDFQARQQMLSRFTIASSGHACVASSERERALWRNRGGGIGRAATHEGSKVPCALASSLATCGHLDAVWVPTGCSPGRQAGGTGNRLVIGLQPVSFHGRTWPTLRQHERYPARLLAPLP